jgi:hypothetical protein
MTARILQVERTRPSGGEATAIGALGRADEYLGFSFDDDQYNIIPESTLQGLDATHFLDFLYIGDPNSGYEFYVDGALLRAGVPAPNSDPNTLFFGNGSSYQNVRAEITFLSFPKGW